ncbi:MAG: thioredoxin family protein [Verrucomicrobiota bacterium]
MNSVFLSQALSRAILSAGILTLMAATPAVTSEVVTEGAAVGEWTMDYDAAKKLAETENLPLLLNFTGSDWCGWCKRMDAAVFAEDEWKDYAAKEVVLVTLDFPQDTSIVPPQFVKRNQELQEEFGVQGYPTYIILDSDAETILGRLGAGADKTPASFIEEMAGILRFRPDNIEAKVAELGAERGAEYREALKTFETAKQDLDEWVATGPVRNPENEKKFEAFLQSISDASDKLDEF